MSTNTTQTENITFTSVNTAIKDLAVAGITLIKMMCSLYTDSVKSEEKWNIKIASGNFAKNQSDSSGDVTGWIKYNKLNNYLKFFESLAPKGTQALKDSWKLFIKICQKGIEAGTIRPTIIVEIGNRIGRISKLSIEIQNEIFEQAKKHSFSKNADGVSLNDLFKLHCSTKKSESDSDSDSESEVASLEDCKSLLETATKDDRVNAVIAALNAEEKIEVASKILSSMEESQAIDLAVSILPVSKKRQPKQTAQAAG